MEPLLPKEGEKMKRTILTAAIVVLVTQSAALLAYAQAPGFPLEEQDKAAMAICCAGITAQQYANASGQEVSSDEILQTAEPLYCGGGSCSAHDKALLKAVSQHLKDGRWHDQICDSQKCESEF